MKRERRRARVQVANVLKGRKVEYSCFVRNKFKGNERGGGWREEHI